MTGPSAVRQLPDLLARCAIWRDAGERIVFTNGVFDLLHYGHLQYLMAARALGDHLIVGLNSDRSTRGNKGPLRPLVHEAERGALLAALRPVDGVVLFDEPTAEQLVTALRPDVYVKGGDYSISAAGELPPGSKPLPEAEIVRGYGGRIELIPYLPGHSTTELIALIMERFVAASDGRGTD
jgi:rfaE bifunctional protein nucleotidyltransferase chain/domain